MGRLVALDYGTKRVGIAVTDPLQIIATPLDTVGSQEIIPFLKKYVLAEIVDAFVVGMPKSLANKDTDATRPAKHFVHLLRKTFPEHPIHLMDERFTSKMAMDAMISGGMKKSERQKRENIDKLSATIILQSYLEKISL